ncbi:Similar to RRP9: U3 small nucleolar RNA-interacting protein 2 (Homo sapiens) [Cotesia congregata]|uniref:Similar to RRP9: U3 small nucleolar RNA-interacting protein 2 (Homo sapiens) n=1 Tax=Cotesia congregata TaxID=51543 RepID=A0A8J2HHG5_COTCN|nr:Similar to RRP9: U3 small nucleolar RNA-interacting protein 2 (Homo sapiens) [Cotesia congregata]
MSSIVRKKHGQGNRKRKVNETSKNKSGDLNNKIIQTGDQDDVEDIVARRLQEEYLEEKGRLKKTVASHYTGHEDLIDLKCKNHRDSITCLCVSRSLSDRKKIHVIGAKKNNKEAKSILCMAVSSDDKFFTVGQAKSNDIKVYNPDNLTLIKNLTKHRGSVTGLAFRRDTHTLYSASEDRSVNVWNLDDMAYVESLFGHQSPITSIDAMTQERCITSGGYDRSIRLWKIVQESQLIFNDVESSSSVDSVKFINDQHFLSCGDNGQLCLWNVMKKTPKYSLAPAHGSRDGNVKLWHCEDSFKSLKLLFEWIYQFSCVYTRREKLKACEQRGANLRAYADYLLQQVFRELVSSESVLYLQVFIEDAYESCVGPNHGKLDAFTMMRTIEKTYESLNMTLDKLPKEIVRQCEKEGFTQEMKMMREAEDAAQKFNLMHRLLAALERIMEPPELNIKSKSRDKDGDKSSKRKSLVSSRSSITSRQKNLQLKQLTMAKRSPEFLGDDKSLDQEIKDLTFEIKKLAKDYLPAENLSAEERHDCRDEIE